MRNGLIEKVIYMTEKRFILIDGVKKGTHSGIWDKQKQNNKRTGDELWIGEVVAMLNEGVAIVEENKQLKQINSNLQDFRNFITEQNIFNEKQRKELQLQMLRLYNYFENWFEDSMSPTAFSELWDNVKEDEKWEKR